MPAPPRITITPAKEMANRSEIHACLFLCWSAPSYCVASDLDFDEIFVCEPEYFEICTHGDRSCRWVELVGFEGKPIFKIDTKEKTIALFEGGNLVDKERINCVYTVNGVRYVHGTNPDSNVIQRRDRMGDENRTGTG